MRAHVITAMVIAANVWLVLSCNTKVGYKSYTCDCVQERNGDILDRREYGLQAQDLGEAGVLCNDIEDRVNYPSKEEPVVPAYSCTAKK